MHRKVLGLLTLPGGVLLPLTALAEVPEDFLATPLASAFGEPPTVGEPMLAPDGSRLLFMQQNPLGIYVDALHWSREINAEGDKR